MYLPLELTTYKATFDSNSMASACQYSAFASKYS